MRLGIRRKLIGTLMLVGLLPLGISLLIILIGVAAMRIHSIRNEYEKEASRTAHVLALRLTSELDKIALISRLPTVIDYVRAHQADSVGDMAAHEKVWSAQGDNGPLLRQMTRNPLADQLRMISLLDARQRQIMVTDAAGLLIAADHHSADYVQSDEKWWQLAYDNGRGQAYISSITTNPVDAKPIIEMAIPIYDDRAKPRRIIGIIKDKVYVTLLSEPLLESQNVLGAMAQLYDTSNGKTVYAVNPSGEIAKAQHEFGKVGRDSRLALIRPLLGNPVIGSARVPMDIHMQPYFASIVHPNWAVIVSKPPEEAMSPVYKLGLTVAIIGLALILVLFIVGVAIANREIILPILRLRAATAAVGRGELNIRLLSDGQARGDTTFRGDELGDLAHDFDEMTRELQKNVGQLARSNEAKRRFMELAGHELRTPVTYILGVCGLAQRQTQQNAANVSMDEGQATVTTARASASANAALQKIALKAQRLSRIIENLLKLVNNDQFTTRLNKQPIDMRALVLQVCNDHRPFVLERKQQLQVDVAENLPTLDGDRDKLEDVLTNLISNAIRFSPDGGTITVAAHPIIGDMLEILVTDSGPGIPEKDLAELFEPFYTGSDVLHHTSGTFEYGSKGIGLGLAIVRRFVEIHGGAVKAYPGNPGVRFQILLPLPSRDDPLPAALPVPAK